MEGKASGFGSLHHQLAFVIKVAVNVIGSVVNMYGSGNRTLGKGWQNGLVVGPSFISSGTGMSAFWMWHDT
jgi:hypothetical protein